MQELLGINGVPVINSFLLQIGQRVRLRRSRVKIPGDAVGYVVAVQEHLLVGPCAWVQVVFGETRTAWGPPAEFELI
ncbi:MULTISPECIES: hypothetical protein [unclassified Bradyrhizobium]|uniref:hypothetical protein n=1 Tax=unclassified Bradyrhizobium TaxID=2631580 RepID=UPI0029160F22|nr:MULTISPECIES: hypothetical protein [unclassified Bradyrhizobium]